MINLKRLLGVVALMYAALLTLSTVSKAADLDTDKDKPKPTFVQPSFGTLVLPSFTYSDNRLTYAHVFGAIDAGFFSPKPGGGYNGKTDMDVLAYSHFDAWTYGTNFLLVGLSKSGLNDPAGPCTNAGVIQDREGSVSADCAGATDIYGLIRSTIGFNEIFNTHKFTWGPLHDVSLEVGGDADSGNTYFDSAKRQFVAGLQFAFDLPYRGYLDIAPLWKNELGHNAYTQCGSIFAHPAPACNIDGNAHYQDTWALEINYYMDLGFLPQSIQYFSISGRAGIYGPKGPFQGIGGQESTKTEINTEPVRITFDAGKALLGKASAHEVDLWAAYRYWQNQYGEDADSAPYNCTVTTNGVKVSTNSCTASSLATGVTVKF
ncbi:hypothetical protein CWB41_07120 [Methylovirgula ligni]|uniref:OmpL-like beta-barrel porin-2 n=2 Tax=Methylovirgula ligni TaxID=569860 RepID=A0A3D9ZCC4_9HYPH|nr:hypothetical protein CWB41_07120 [Methylovirgula ligni]REF89126.1 hypothetical protein DES32_0341 [Methylovirgula ligni]